MLTTGQIVKLFAKSKGPTGAPTFENIVKLMQHVNIVSEMDRNGIDYHYKVNLLELSKSDIPDDDIFGMVNEGWKLSKDRKSIEYIF